MIKYPNLAAEQARNGHTNEYVAKYLNISRPSYELKKIKVLLKSKNVKNYAHYTIVNLNIYLTVIKRLKNI